MSTSGGGGVLKDLGHPGLNEALKSHNGVTFKLVKTGKYGLRFSVVRSDERQRKWGN